MKRWRIAFVIPRYGGEVLGGAETLTQTLAERVTSAGIADVQVLTTCARDHVNWKNELPPGETQINGVSVLRFPMYQKYGDLNRYHSLQLRLIQGEIIPVEEQYEWIDQGPHSPELYGFIESQGRRFDFLIFVPYLFGTSYYGSAIHPERSILWPCLHNEAYAYLSPTRDMYRACLGAMFNSYPELRLAHRLYGSHPRSQVIGFGMSPLQGNADRFRRKYRISAPFVLYAGRLEGAKNVPLLIENFVEYKHRRRNQLKLVLMGSGPETGPKHRDILTIGFRPVQEKNDAFAAATVLCQPSVNESFSIVLMESWLNQVPVLVHADCEVTRYHVTQCNGGLYFRTYEEFEAVVDLLLADEPLRKRMAENGKQYVQTEYNWDAVLERFQTALTQWSTARSA